jgi:hypothetical protein
MTFSNASVSVVELVYGGVPELVRELLAGCDGCFRFGEDLLGRLDGVDDVDGHVLGHVRVVVSNDVFRRFFLRDDRRLSKRLAELRDGLTSLGKLETFKAS